MQTMRGQRFVWRLLFLALLCGSAVACRKRGVDLSGLSAPAGAVARVVVFEAQDCEQCARVRADVIDPLRSRCGNNLEVRFVDVGTRAGYEAFVATEKALVGQAGRWEVPTVVVGDEAFVGVRAITEQLVPRLACIFNEGGNAWPEVAELEAFETTAPTPAARNPFGLQPGQAIQGCANDEDEAAAVCEAPMPIAVLYVAPDECDDSCDRVRYDLRYLRGVYPGLTIEEWNIREHHDQLEALWERLGVPQVERDQAPAVVVGEDYLTGDALRLDALRETIGQYADSGAAAIWSGN